MSKLVLPFLKTPAQGAQTSIYLASSPSMDGVTGEFFANGKPKTVNRVAYDTDVTRPGRRGRLAIGGKLAEFVALRGTFGAKDAESVFG